MCSSDDEASASRKRQPSSDLAARCGTKRQRCKDQERAGHQRDRYDDPAQLYDSSFTDSEQDERDDDDDDDDDDDEKKKSDTSSLINVDGSDAAANLIVPLNDDGAQYIDITQYMCMPQSKAAKALGIPASTLSKRWKEATNDRKWPYRVLSKLDKRISTLLQNLRLNPESADLEKQVAALIGERQKYLQQVAIRL
jgi:hypothetical protein